MFVNTLLSLTGTTWKYFFWKMTVIFFFNAPSNSLIFVFFYILEILMSQIWNKIYKSITTQQTYCKNILHFSNTNIWVHPVD